MKRTNQKSTLAGSRPSLQGSLDSADETIGAPQSGTGNRGEHEVLPAQANCDQPFIPPAGERLKGPYQKGIVTSPEISPSFDDALGRLDLYLRLPNFLQASSRVENSLCRCFFLVSLAGNSNILPCS
eukprot:gene24422-10020_t